VIDVVRVTTAVLVALDVVQVAAGVMHEQRVLTNAEASEDRVERRLARKSEVVVEALLVDRVVDGWQNDQQDSCSIVRTELAMLNDCTRDVLDVGNEGVL